MHAGTAVGLSTMRLILHAHTELLIPTFLLQSHQRIVVLKCQRAVIKFKHGAFSIPPL